MLVAIKCESMLFPSIRKYFPIFSLILIFLIAVFFRFYKLPTIPFGLNNDAAWEASAALDMLRGNIGPYLPYAAEGWRGEGIIRVLVAFFMLLIGNDPITIRLASNVFGLGLIIPLFILIRKLFDTSLAIITTFFVAISGWHITMSKTGWRAITVPFFSTLTFLFFFKGLDSKRFLDFVLVGVFLALGSLYTYDAGRVLLLLFTAWLLFTTVTTKGFFTTYKKHLAVLLVSFVIFSAPMVYYGVAHWENFTSRSEFVFIGHQIQQARNLSPLWNNIVTAALLFNVKANGNDFFIFEPLVDKPISWLLPIGLLIVLWRVFTSADKRYIFMLLWLFASLIPGIFSIPNGNRAIGAIPSVYFFAAIGILFISNIPIRMFKLNKQVITTIIIIFCVISAYLTYNDYLGPRRRELFGFYPETLIISQYIKTVDNKYNIYIAGRHPPELQTYYLYRKENNNPFSKNSTWLDTSFAFLELATQQKHLVSETQNRFSNVLGTTVNIKKKGMAFFMSTTAEDKTVANQLLQTFKNASKFYLWYDNDTIHRPASLVVLVPPF